MVSEKKAISVGCGLQIQGSIDEEPEFKLEQENASDPSNLKTALEGEVP